MMDSPPFSIVINTDGRRDSLERTLRSLRFIDYPSFEVCVVYGPTSDGTKALLEGYTGQIKVGHCPVRNLSMSRNIGIAMSAGVYVAFIDDDAFPEAEWLRDLERGYDGQKVGGSGGRVYDHTGWRYQYGYAFADRLGNARGDLTAPVDEFNFPLSDKFPYLQGTNASFRRDALLEIGGFDEEIEFYLDETDVCCRLIDAGFTLRQLPNAFVYHKFLPSHIRNDHRVTRNRFPIIKNKIYFSIVNNHGHYGMNDVVEDNRRFISDQAQEMMMHADAGRLTADDVTQFWQDADRAWKCGLTSGLSGTRRLLNTARAAAFRRPFLKFPRETPSGGRKVFCFLSKEYPPGRIGGIGTYTESVAAELSKLGHHVHVLTQSESDNTVDFEDGVWVHRLNIKNIEPKPVIEAGVPPHIWNYSATMREELYRIARRRSITAVEFPIWDVEGIALIGGGFPCVVSLHTTLGIWLETHDGNLHDPKYMQEFGRPMLALEKYLMLKSDGVHANSAAIVQVLCDHYDVSLEQTNLRIIHHGIRDPAPRPTMHQSRANGEINILFVGRLERRKGVDVLLNSIATLLVRYKEISCDVVGDDSVPWGEGDTFREAFADWPIAAACEGHVRFHGKVSSGELRRFFMEADILVVPSRFESFGLTVIEGFAFGKAVVAARAGGIAEIVNDGHTGLLVSPSDVGELVEALDSVIANSELRSKLGEAARAEYERRFSGKRMAHDVAQFLSEFERSIVRPSEMTLSGGAKLGIGLWGDETGIMLAPGDELEFRARGKTLYVTFWRHPWSGFARLLNGNQVIVEWDLYAEVAQLTTFVLHDIPIEASLIITPTGQHAAKSQGSEAIFYKAAFSSECMKRPLAGAY